VAQPHSYARKRHSEELDWLQRLDLSFSQALREFLVT